MRRALHPLIAAIAMAGAAARAFGALPNAPGEAAPVWNVWGGLRHRGQPSINHRQLAARSHAGKPAGYVKAY